MNVIPFGRTPAERRKNAERAARAETKTRHPAGSKRPLTEQELREASAFEPDWLSKYPSRTEARRAQILDTKTCKDCGVTVDWPNGSVHPTGMCRVCRAKRPASEGEAADTPADTPADPSLF